MSDAHDRYHPDTFKAHAVGAFACSNCMAVHIDMIDEAHNVIGTATISFEQFLQLASQVVDGIDELDPKT